MVINAPEPSPLATDEPHLTLHANLYAAAQTYDIDGLKALSLDKFKIQVTRHWYVRIASFSALICKTVGYMLTDYVPKQGLAGISQSHPRGIQFDSQFGQGHARNGSGRDRMAQCSAGQTRDRECDYGNQRTGL